jgi:hypothetical protein
MVSILVTSLVLGLAGQHLSPPPDLVTNGDARGGASGWERQRVPETVAARDLAKDAFVETRDGIPCFVMRNKASWVQRVVLHDDSAGKFLLIIGRGASERVHLDGNITGLPYLWAHLIHDGPASNANYLQGMILKSDTPNAWATMHGIFPMPKGVRAITLKLGQAERRGTPQTGSAARVTDVQMRLFETRGAAEAYVAAYSAFHDPR